MKLIAKWLLSAMALLAVAHFYPGVVVTSFVSALIAAFVIGLLNTFVRPILGLFLFIINALMFYMASGLLDGFNVKSFGAALIGSLLYSVAGMIIEAALERVFKKD
jgi:putative membrane protein